MAEETATVNSDLYFRQILVGEMANFAYLVGSRSTREALVVDPAWNVDALVDQAAEDGLEVVGALVTWKKARQDIDKERKSRGFNGLSKRHFKVTSRR